MSSLAGRSSLPGWVAAVLLLAACGGGGGSGGGKPLPALVSVTVSPAAPTVAAGIDQPFTAVAAWDDGSSRDVTAEATWTSSAPAVATFPGAAGLARAVDAGPATVAAAYGARTGTSALTVTGHFASVTCLGDAACPEIAVSGDPYAAVAGNTLRGFADASVRRSLDGATLYMAYSWPTLVTAVTPATREIETHLARSTDDGTTWTSLGPIFRAGASETIPGTTQQGVRSSEEISMVAAALDPTKPALPYWIWVRERYYRPLGLDLQYTTYHLRIGAVQAASPAALAGTDADEQVLLDKNDGAWFRAAMPADALLLTDILAGTGQEDCDYPVSPALAYDAASAHLYLVLQCFVAGTSPADDAARSRLIVLRTTPYQGGVVLPARSWAWEYRGSFGGQDTAALMQKDGIPGFLPDMVLQPDLAWSGSTLLLVATPTIHDASGDGRTGCQVLELQGIDPPAVKMQNGQLVRRAVVDAPDLDATRYSFGRQGGSCGYEPGATGVGLVFARKRVNTSGVVTTALFATGVHE